MEAHQQEIATGGATIESVERGGAIVVNPSIIAMDIDWGTRRVVPAGSNHLAYVFGFSAVTPSVTRDIYMLNTQTKAVTQITNLAQSSPVSNGFVHNNNLYYRATLNGSSYSLFKFDPVANTHTVITTAPYSPMYKVLNGSLIVANGGTGQIVKVNTDNSTELIATSYYPEFSDIPQMDVLNNRLYYFQSNTIRAWDGTSSIEVVPAAPGRYLRAMISAGSYLFIDALNNTTNRRELYALKPDNSMVLLVGGLYPDSPSETIWDQVVAKPGLVFIKARNFGVSGELQTGKTIWVSDGTPENTKAAVPTSSNHHQISTWGVVGSSAYMAVNKDSTGCQMLFKMDLSTFTSTQVMDYPGMTYDGSGCMNSRVDIIRGIQESFLTRTSGTYKLYRIND